MTHPLSRFAAEQLDKRQAGLRAKPVTAFETRNRAGWNLPSGRYVFLVERWSIEGIVPVDKLAFAACSFSGERLLEEDQAERVLIESLTSEARMTSLSSGDCDRAHNLAADVLAGRLEERRLDFEDAEAARHFDLVSTQKALIEEHRTRETKKYKERISDLQFSQNLKRRNLIPALEGKLQKVLARLELRENEIRQREDLLSYEEPLLVGIAVIDITGDAA